MRNIRLSPRIPHLSLALLALPVWLAPMASQAMALQERTWMSGLSAPVSTDRLIIKYRQGQGAYPSASAQMAARVAANRQGVQIQHHRQMANGAQVFRMSRHMSLQEAQAMARSLHDGDRNIEYVEPDRIHVPMLVPNDSRYAEQWSLFDATGGIRAPAAWDKATGTGVTIAVLDTGYRPHADLLTRLLPGHDFIADAARAGDGNGRDADASDPGDAARAGQCGTGSPASTSSWHGTHVAGIAAASGGNALGVTGVAFNARLLPVRVLGQCGGYSSDIADAIIWAAGGSVSGVPVNVNPARVINLSLGGRGSCDITTQNAINTARSRGAVVVVAAGNDGVDAANTSPANCSGVVTVAATGKSGSRASYSNFGSQVALAAPGGDRDAAILSTWNSGSSSPGADSYAGMMGTSMATPVVSGVAALMLSANPALSPDQVAQLLKSSARKFPGLCNGCGTGIVDAQAAVNLALAAKTSSAPTPTPAPPPKPSPAPQPSPAPSPTPSLTIVGEQASNDSLATAQLLAKLPVLVNGSTGSLSDNDYYRITLPAGRRATVLLQPMASSQGLSLGAYLLTGQQLLLSPAPAGASQQMQLSNPGNSPIQVVIRVLRSSGSIGSYQMRVSL